MAQGERASHYQRSTRPRDLTPRQREVLALLADGCTNAEIAARLDISLDGAKYHVSEILTRLNVSSRQDAADWWRREQSATTKLSRLGGGAMTAALWKWAGIAGGIVAATTVIAVTVALVGETNPGETTSDVAAPPGEAASPTADEAPLFPLAAEIVRRSDEAMAGRRVIIEELDATATSFDVFLVEHGVRVREVMGREQRTLWTEYGEPPASCEPIQLPTAELETRSERGSARSDVPARGSAAADFELLGQATMDGVTSWQVRYQYRIPGEHGPATVERVEWIAVDDYRLLRAEQSVVAPAQEPAITLMRITAYDGPPAPCPRQPSTPREEMGPILGLSGLQTLYLPRDIVRRSEQAMAGRRVVTESLRVERLREDVPHDITVQETMGTEQRMLWRAGSAPPSCDAMTLPAAPLETRSQGGLALYDDPDFEAIGASAPEEFELLGVEVLDGVEAWRVRFRYSLPSEEGPVWVERTEWIATHDYRLLRTEVEELDRFGFIGQIITTFVDYDGAPAPCPREPTAAPEELAPLTTPRLPLESGTLGE